MAYFDLGREARKNEHFQETLREKLTELREAEVNKGVTEKGRHDVVTKIREVYDICHQNTGLMLPYFFPRFNKDGSPLSLSRRPFAFSLFDLNVGGVTTIRGSRQISKSTSLVARQLIHQHMFPKWSSCYIVPHPEHKVTYGNKMADMENCFRFFKKHYKLRQNLYYKQSPSGSVIEIHNVLASPAKLRGKTFDELLFDEYQLFDMDFERDIEQTQRVTAMPVVTYSGTSTTLDSPLESRYQGSSMGTWHCRSGDGRTWLDFGDKDEVLKMIQPKGLTCPKTSRLINVLNGEWVHGDERMLQGGNFGFHVPQIIVPDFVNDLVEWAKIYEIFKKGDIPKFLQEIIGIPVAEGSREISEADLRAICFLGPKAALQQRAKTIYKFIVSGCDWGGSDYQPQHRTKKSYTVHVVLGVLATGEFDILHMARYTGMDYDEIAQYIVNDHVRLGGTAVASDYGVGMAYNDYLRRKLPKERHVIMEYLGPNTQVIGKPEHGMFNHYTLNKVEAVSQTIMALKRAPSPRIRCYDWEEARDYLLDILNVYRSPVETIHGRSAFRFIRNPSKADDTLHAITFAYTLGRLMLREPVIPDSALHNAILSIMSGGSDTKQIFSSLGHVSG